MGLPLGERHAVGVEHGAHAVVVGSLALLDPADLAVVVVEPVGCFLLREAGPLAQFPQDFAEPAHPVSRLVPAHPHHLRRPSP